MVCQHETTHTVAGRDVGTPLRQRNLDTCRSPGDECRQTPLADTEQTLVHVCRVNLTLDDVENGDVAAFLARLRRHHAVLGLQQTAHHVQHRRLAHSLGLLDLVSGEGRVSRHEEVASRRGDQRSLDADEIVVHVPGVS